MAADSEEIGDSGDPEPCDVPAGLTKMARFRSRTTRIRTCAGALSTNPSLTTSWKVRSLISFGAVKLGVATPARVPTEGPRSWVHRKVRLSPSGSLLALPSSVTMAPAVASPSARTSAIGGVFVRAGSVGLSEQAASASVSARKISTNSGRGWVACGLLPGVS
ncbi:MAG: hypothetical protein EA351_14300 [Gemmatimonadales bacterium]|nr:MAG: hypothetical protein EA351_14300 [Gemmatimonadales bacterium]